MLAYCLACTVGRERALKSILQNAIEAEIIFPVREVTERRNGKWIRRDLSLTPGYLFMFAREDVAIYRAMCHEIRRVLGYDGKPQPLIGADLDYAEWAFRNHGRIVASGAIVKDGRVRITSGPLTDCPGRVIRVDRHKRRAQVEFMFMNRARSVWLSLDEVETV